jgi:hypothetical protein
VLAREEVIDDCAALVPGRTDDENALDLLGHL